MPHATADDGVKLYYEETGSGEPILFIHEFADDYRGWEPQVRYFSRRYRCITYNARGYPPSDVPENASSYSQMRAVGDAIAMQIEVYIHLGGAANMAKAQVLMQGVDNRFGQFPQLVNQIQRLQINNLIERGEVVKAQDMIKKFVEQFHDQGGPMIRGVLDEIDSRARSLRAANQNAKAAELDKIGAGMANLLLNWAKPRHSISKTFLIPHALRAS